MSKMSDLPDWMMCTNCSDKNEYPNHCERCDAVFCYNCWGSCRATLYPKTPNTNVKNIDICSDCHKKQWIKSEYGYQYSCAVRKSKEEDRNLWFDPRWWKDDDIKEFFKDLDFADSHVYECIVNKISDTKYRVSRTKKSREKYLKYCQEQFYLHESK